MADNELQALIAERDRLLSEYQSLGGSAEELNYILSRQPSAPPSPAKETYRNVVDYLGEAAGRVGGQAIAFPFKVPGYLAGAGSQLKNIATRIPEAVEKRYRDPSNLMPPPFRGVGGIYDAAMADVPEEDRAWVTARTLGEAATLLPQVRALGAVGKALPLAAPALGELADAVRARVIGKPVRDPDEAAERVIAAYGMPMAMAGASAALKGTGALARMAQQAFPDRKIRAATALQTGDAMGDLVGYGSRTNRAMRQKMTGGDKALGVAEEYGILEDVPQFDPRNPGTGSVSFGKLQQNVKGAKELSMARRADLINEWSEIVDNQFYEVFGATAPGTSGLYQTLMEANRAANLAAPGLIEMPAGSFQQLFDDHLKIKSAIRETGTYDSGMAANAVDRLKNKTITDKAAASLKFADAKYRELFKSMLPDSAVETLNKVNEDFATLHHLDKQLMDKADSLGIMKESVQAGGSQEHAAGGVTTGGVSTRLAIPSPSSLAPAQVRGGAAAIKYNKALGNLVEDIRATVQNRYNPEYLNYRNAFQRGADNVQGLMENQGMQRYSPLAAAGVGRAGMLNREQEPSPAMRGGRGGVTWETPLNLRQGGPTMDRPFDSTIADSRPSPEREWVAAFRAGETKHSPLLRAVAMTESSFNPKARSPVGAQGLMQFMPKTAKWVLEKMGSDEEWEPHNPEQQVRMADWYLNDYLAEKFNSLPLALAAYNWGEGNVRKTMRRYGSDWESIQKAVPSETRAYVDRVSTYLNQYSSEQGGIG